MFICPECGHAASKWFGRCPGCGEWAGAIESGPGPVPAPVSALQAPQTEPSRHPRGIAELDRVLGGGYLTGAVMLFAGEPGIGKSTLVLQLLAGIPASTGLLVSGEESAAQVSLRAARLGIGGDSILVAATTSLEAVLEVAAAERPGVCDRAASLCEVGGCRGRAGWPCNEGRRSRRPQVARAHSRRRRHARGRTGRNVATTSRHQEPIRTE